MKNKSTRPPINAQIYEEACEWFLEFRTEETDIAVRAAFDCWMRRSPEHIAAYLEVAAVWSEPAAHDARGKWDTEALIAQARAASDNVLPLAGNRAPAGHGLSTLSMKDGNAPNRSADSGIAARASGDLKSPAVTARDNGACPAASPRCRQNRVGRRYAFAASVALAIVCAGTTVWYRAQGTTYITDLGEQRSISLADGSIVELNSKTIIRVRYRRHERKVDIRQGQALFKVVSNSERPFVVESNGTRVRAVGTQFDVYRKTLGTVVTVVEGSVAVSPPATALRSTAANRQAQASSVAATDATAKDSDRVLLLKADEQVTVAPNTSPHIARGAASMAVAWTRRKIVFSGASLTEVAEEFNRYSARRLIVENPGEYDFRVSGVFSSADVTSIVRFLRTRPGVEVEEGAVEIRIRKKPALEGIQQQPSTLFRSYWTSRHR